MDKISSFYQFLPGDKIDWELIKKTLLELFYENMEKTIQDTRWHAEGNVLIHTKMDCEELIKLNEFQNLLQEEKLVVFLAALFHDVGKTVTTKELGSEITSPNHGIIGSLMIRELLWRDYDLAGSEEYQAFREGICLLIRYHSTPVHEYANLTKKVIKTSLNSSLTHYFNIKLLAILAKADILGRIGISGDEFMNNLELFTLEAMDLECYDKPFNFTDSYTKFQYLVGENIWQFQSLYNNHWGKVYLICGLPGTGKDTYIKKHFADLPIISLDAIREEFKISPLDDQSEVVEIAKERAKEHLREHRSFVWNATNLTNLVRNKLLNLFHDYQASVKIFFLETSLKNNLERNKNRERCVDEKVIYKLLRNLNIPEAYEAEEVEWVCL